jgi:H+/Cl- antiporter ClcA
LIQENPYAPTRAPLADQTNPANTWPSAIARFLWTVPTGFTLYLSVIVVQHREDWLEGALGSAIMGTIAGLVAMCIPVKNKAAFIVPALFAGVAVGYLIGKTRGH